MKTLHANNSLIISLYIWIIIESIFIILELCVGFSSETLYMIGLGIVIFIPLLIWGIYIRSTHQIQYGEGKIIIRRISKKWQSGFPAGVGKWLSREDEFLLEDVETCGMSKIGGYVPKYPLGYQVEYHRNSGSKYASECYFKLKDGKEIGYTPDFYTKKQIKEFSEYIHNEIGMMLLK